MRISLTTLWLLIATVITPAIAEAEGWYGGGEFLLVKPTVDFETAFNVDSTNATGGSDDRAVDFDRDLDPAFRLWLGKVSDGGTSVRARFWYFSQDENKSIVANSTETLSAGVFSDLENNNPGGSGTTMNSLTAFTVDLEAGQIFRPTIGQFHLGGGLRIASLDTEIHSELVDPVDGLFSEDSKFDSVGFGPTVFAEYERSVNTSLNVFASFRNSILFNESDISSTSSDTFTLGATDNSVIEVDDISMIQETRFGLSTLRPVGSQHLVASVFLEHQFWSSGSSVLIGDTGFFGLGIQLGLVR